MYGQSTSNQVIYKLRKSNSESFHIQKIEAWWSQLRQRYTEWWITLFKVHKNIIFRAAHTNTIPCRTYKLKATSQIPIHIKCVFIASSANHITGTYSQ